MVGGRNGKDAVDGRWSERESSPVRPMLCSCLSVGRKSGPDRRRGAPAGQARWTCVDEKSLGRDRPVIGAEMRLRWMARWVPLRFRAVRQKSV